jgi:hypothetical protein
LPQNVHQGVTDAGLGELVAAANGQVGDALGVRVIAAAARELTQGGVVLCRVGGVAPSRVASLSAVRVATRSVVAGFWMLVGWLLLEVVGPLVALQPASTASRRMRYRRMDHGGLDWDRVILT